MRMAKKVTLSESDQLQLTKFSRGRSTPARVVLRAKIVLLAAAGQSNKQIAAELGTSRKTVGEWRNRFIEQGLAGIQQDAPRSGRQQSSTTVSEILRKTTTEKPPGLHPPLRPRGDRISVCRKSCVVHAQIASVMSRGLHLVPYLRYAASGR